MAKKKDEMQEMDFETVTTENLGDSLDDTEKGDGVMTDTTTLFPEGMEIATNDTDIQNEAPEAPEAELTDDTANTAVASEVPEMEASDLEDSFPETELIQVPMDTGDEAEQASRKEAVEELKGLLSGNFRDKSKKGQRMDMVQNSNDGILGTDGQIVKESALDEGAVKLIQARNNHRIIQATIFEIIESTRFESPDIVHAMYEGCRISIPATEMSLDLRVIPDEAPKETIWRIRRRLHAMMNAVINVRVLDLDVDEQGELFAVGSQKIANRSLQRVYLHGTDSRGQYYIYPGRQVMGRVIVTSSYYALVEVMGRVCRLGRNEISLQYVEDVADNIRNGEEVKLFVTTCDRDTEGRVTRLEVSMRNDENELAQIKKKAAELKPGVRLTATVTKMTTKSIQLRMTDSRMVGYCLLHDLKGYYIPKQGDTVACRLREVKKGRNGVPVLRVSIERRV